MKIINSKISVFVILLLSGAALSACGRSETDMAYTYQIYCLNRQETTIAPVEYGTNQEDMKELLVELLFWMKTYPDKPEYIPPLTGDFALLGYEIADRQIILDFDEKYKELPVIREVLTRAALVRTLTQVQGIDYVSITIRSEPLTDAGGGLIGVMSADTFVDNAGSEINAYDKARLRLYFTNEEGESLIPVQRNIVYSTNISMEKLVVEQLIRGPQEDERGYPTINSATKIISVTVKDGTCYVNLDRTFLTQQYPVSASATIYSITNSLVELSNINKVQIAVDGDTSITYKETISLNSVFERNLDILEGN